MSQKMGGTEETLCVVCQKVRVHKANESENGGGHRRNTVCRVPIVWPISKTTTIKEKKYAV